MDQQWLRSCCGRAATVPWPAFPLPATVMSSGWSSWQPRAHRGFRFAAARPVFPGRVPRSKVVDALRASERPALTPAATSAIPAQDRSRMAKRYRSSGLCRASQTVMESDRMQGVPAPHAVITVRQAVLADPRRAPILDRRQRLVAAAQHGQQKDRQERGSQGACVSAMPIM